MMARLFFCHIRPDAASSDDFSPETRQGRFFFTSSDDFLPEIRQICTFPTFPDDFQTIFSQERR